MKRDGKEIKFYKNGQIEFERTWKNNELNGEEIEYFENGEVKSKKNWVNGVKQ